MLPRWMLHRYGTHAGCKVHCEILHKHQLPQLLHTHNGCIRHGQRATAMEGCRTAAAAAVLHKVCELYWRHVTNIRLVFECGFAPF